MRLTCPGTRSTLAGKGKDGRGARAGGVGERDGHVIVSTSSSCAPPRQAVSGLGDFLFSHKVPLLGDMQVCILVCEWQSVSYRAVGDIASLAVLAAASSDNSASVARNSIAQLCLARHILNRKADTFRTVPI